jgi:hypothetical protein
MGVVADELSSAYLLVGPDLSGFPKSANGLEVMHHKGLSKAIAAFGDAVIARLRHFADSGHGFDPKNPKLNVYSGMHEETIAAVRFPVTKEQPSTEVVLGRFWTGEAEKRGRPWDRSRDGEPFFAKSRLFTSGDGMKDDSNASFSNTVPPSLSRFMASVGDHVKALSGPKPDLITYALAQAPHFCNLCGDDRLRSTGGKLVGADCGHETNIAV